MAITIHDLVILGTAVPEEIRDGRKTVCVAGWHPDLKLIRLYPTRVTNGLHRWCTVTARVERNRQDTRTESWKLVGSRDWELLQFEHIGGKIGKPERLAIIDSCAAACPRDLDQTPYRSLAIIRVPEITRCAFVPNPTKQQPQRQLIGYASEAFANTKADYAFVPKLSFRCVHGHEHDATVVEWGAYEWMRKHPHNTDGFWINNHMQDSAWAKHLLIGNQCHARTSWIVISIIPMETDGVGNAARACQTSLPLSLPLGSAA